MARFSPARPRLLAATAAGVAMVLITTFLTQFPSRAAAGSVGPQSTSADEAAAGLVALAPSYPGGLPALLGLFETGECAGIQSYETAPPACTSILDRIAQLGAGHAFPERIPDLSGNPGEIVPPNVPPDP